MEAYDPDMDQDVVEWLALSELERIDLVAAFHREAGGYGENLHMHSVVHAVVENQLALAQPAEVRRSLARLVSDGLSRHEALHAIGGVVVEFLFPILQAKADPPEFDASGYSRCLSKITAADWRSDV